MARKNGTSIITRLRNGDDTGVRNAPGRPRTTMADLPPNWEQIMRDEAQVGHGVTAFMVKLGLTRKAFSTLLEDHEQFRDTYEICLLLSQYWWETTGKELSDGSRRYGNAQAWTFNMKNRFDWKDRNEILGHPGGGPIDNRDANRVLTKEELRQELEARGLPASLLLQQPTSSTTPAQKSGVVPQQPTSSTPKKKAKP